ncbi:hypothetical protein ONZ45_g8403 [Pleurotus djamor]|nr:hypothetical protein ONZ45_g8403 [Pleurotus djamor]
MASSLPLVAAPSLSKLSISSEPGSSQANHIDLTLDDDSASNDHYGQDRYAKRPRMGYHDAASPFAPTPQRADLNSIAYSTAPAFGTDGRSFSTANWASGSTSHYRPPSTMQPSISPFYSSNGPQPQPGIVRGASSLPSIPSASQARPLAPAASDPQVIDLTTSPSPPPSQPVFANQPLSPDVSPRTPVCIGQLHVNALVLSHISYIMASPGRENEWVPVKFRYDFSPMEKKETIQIRTIDVLGPSGEVCAGEMFGVLEQKATAFIGNMLQKGIIRLEPQIRKLNKTLPIFPLQMLVYTPKGNIPHVAKYLEQCRLMLDHPSSSFDYHRIAKCPYYNPHNPPPGGYNQAHLAKLGYADNRSSSMVGRSVEVQRSQAEQLFKTMKDGEDLAETESPSEIATRLYPHQKRALTFLLDRELEVPASEGEFCSLWQKHIHPATQQPVWSHALTQEEVFHAPSEPRGSILADDMGLGKTITTVSLIAATLATARQFGSEPLEPVSPPSASDASDLFGNGWDISEQASQKAQAKAARNLEKLRSEYVRASRIKTKSRATLILCPLSTVSNWEDQFKDHWKGNVTIIGGSGCAPPPMPSTSGSSTPSQSTLQITQSGIEAKSATRKGPGLRVYVYHGNARRPDTAFLADFDAVITTYATLASEYSKQNRSQASPEAEEEEEGGSSDCGGVDIDANGNQTLRLPKPKKSSLKRKKPCTLNLSEIASPLQSIHWFRVVLDEAHSIKETSTVGSRASCDLYADRRLCLTGTPVQNKLDDVFALIKFLRLSPFDDKNIWTQMIGGPVKVNQPAGITRLQTLMRFITLRRTKESRTADGKQILTLPPRHDSKRILKFGEKEQAIYDRFFNQSQAEFQEMTDKNEVMKNYVGILQRILRLRQICDHVDLVQGKVPDSTASYDDIVAVIAKEGIDSTRASAIFSILRESATTQCVECGIELCTSADSTPEDAVEDSSSTSKRGRKPKGTQSRAPTRPSSPASPQPILSRCLHLFCIECFRNAVYPGWPGVPPDSCRVCSACQTTLRPQDAVEVKADQVADPVASSSTSKKKTSKSAKRSKPDPETYHSSTKIDALIHDLMPLSRANPHSANYDAEVQMIDQDGRNVAEEPVKTIVFSQWTSMLDKIEDALVLNNIRYDRLDGTMKREDRTRAMDALKHDPACEVLLVSLKAGGVGLNLTAAQRVYLMDPYWNPAVENQAVDRIHRLGQTRPVQTIKFVIGGSIEERLLEVQKRKTELAEMTLGSSFSKSELLAKRLEDLNTLFS